MRNILKKLDKQYPKLRKYVDNTLHCLPNGNMLDKYHAYVLGIKFDKNTPLGQTPFFSSKIELKNYINKHIENIKNTNK
jgi:hypothetical protein